MVIELNGHSGCIITIVDGESGLIVRKKSPDANYNERLIAQHDKQANLSFPKVFVTPTLSSGYDSEGLYYFDMPYINGITLSNYIYSIPLDKIPELVSKLVDRDVDLTQYDGSAKETIRRKTESVINSIMKMDVSNQEDVRDLLMKSESILLNYQWDHMVHSPCHGDYTLENLIIANEDRIYAIDLLDSFYDSWEIDIAKLLQDVELKWSYRFSEKDDNLTVRLMILRSNIIEHIRRMPDGEVLIDHIYHLLLLNTLRIVPYTHDRDTMNFLFDKINYLVTKLR